MQPTARPFRASCRIVSSADPPPGSTGLLRPPRRPCRGVTVMGAVISGGRRSSQSELADPDRGVVEDGAPVGVAGLGAGERVDADAPHEVAIRPDPFDDHDTPLLARAGLRVRDHLAALVAEHDRGTGWGT